MISANVVEELYGAGWIRDDVQDHRIDGRVVQEELWRRGKIVEVRLVGKIVKVLSGTTYIKKIREITDLCTQLHKYDFQSVLEHF